MTIEMISEDARGEAPRSSPPSYAGPRGATERPQGRASGVEVPQPHSTLSSDPACGDAGGERPGGQGTNPGEAALARYLESLGISMPDGRDGLSDEWPGESSGEARFSARLGAEWATFRPGASKPTTVGRLWSSSTLCYAPTLAPFGMHCHDVGIGPGVTNADISFTADDTLTDALVQVALIEGSRVRDIQRCDHNTWSKRLTVRCGSRSVDRVLVMVTAASAGGGYHLRVQAAQPTSDVVVMRQGHPGDGDPVGVPRGPNPPPDLRVVSDHDGALEGRVYLHQDNTLSIRLCNVGNAVARHVFVELWFQDASVQVTSDGWLPVCSRRGVIQHLAGITLEAGASRVFRVPWCPSPSGGSRHFVVCAVVRSLGDHNTEDKRALVTFRDVEVRPLG